MSQMRPGRPEAAALIWDWRARDDSDESAGSGRARLLGSLQGLGAGSVGLLLYRFWSPTVGTVVMAIGALILGAALVSPGGLYRGIQRLFQRLGEWTGIALTWILLVPLFYLFFLPFGLLLRRGRRDRLMRFLDPEAESYWETRERPSSIERQF